MQVEQIHWSAGRWHGESTLAEAPLVLAFGARDVLENPAALKGVRARYPSALLLGCSTAGEILADRVYDDSLSATAVAPADTAIHGCFQEIASSRDSHGVGTRLAGGLPHAGLRHVFVLSDGLLANGSQLVRGLREGLPDGVSVTGGLAGDGSKFERTLVLFGAEVARRGVGAVGLYGDSICVGYASLGGWDPFGPDRIITRARENVLYELDGESALAIYKNYLGEHAAELPASGLLFPLSLKLPGASERVVRTLLAIDEIAQSMTFAGDMPEGVPASFMKANFDRLIDGAQDAAQIASGRIPDGDPDLAILISCVGRKLVLKQRIDDEVEAVRTVLGPRTVMTGFYSYGEISPFTPEARCELHNQTMTITTLRD